MQADSRHHALDVADEALAEMETHAIALAQNAGAILLDYFGHPLEVHYKSEGHTDPVTQADRAAEDAIVRGIRERFPDHGILTEETPDDQGLDREFLWVIDPLDGTTNFLNRFPIFGSSIGVLHRGVPAAGAIFIPSHKAKAGQVYHARKGAGAYVNGERIHIPTAGAPSPTRLTALPPFLRLQFRMGKELRKGIGETRATGSIAYELTLVAAGSLQFAGFGGPSIWDVAAGVLLVEEAGGATLVWRRGKGWSPFQSFAEPGAGLPPDGNLRKWRTALFVGGRDVLDVVARNLRPRRRLFRRLLRALRR